MSEQPEALDRILPTYRPLGWPIGYQRWHSLLLLHWPVPEGVLRPLVPAELEAQLREVTRQVLLLVRAVVDWWLERVDAPGPDGAPAGGGARLQEIPID